MSASEASFGDSPVKRVIDAIGHADPAKLAFTLEQLQAAEPDRWLDLILISGAIPEPDSRDLQSKLTLLLQAGAIMFERPEKANAAVEFAEPILALIDVQMRIKEVRHRLQRLRFSAASTATQLYRLAVFLEDQATLLSKMETPSSDSKFMDPVQLAASTIPNRFDQSRLARSDAFEGLCELIELVVRYVLHTTRGRPLGDVDPTFTPYSDPDFELLLRLGAVWKELQRLWWNVKFCGWRLHGKCQGQLLYGPPDKDEFIRLGTAEARERLLMAEAYLPEFINPTEFSNSPDRSGRLASSITIPAAADCWDGKLDEPLLADAIRSTHFDRLDELFLHKRHYRPVLGDVVVSTDRRPVPWPEWIRVYRTLQVLAEAMSHAMRTQIIDTDIRAEMRRPIIVRRVDLAGIVSRAMGLHLNTSSDAISLLVFDARRKHLEIWDQPLVPLDAERCLLLPNVLTTAHPAQAVEHFLEQAGGTSFGKRGKPFERHLAAIFEPVHDARVRHGLTLPLDGGQELEFDIIVWWGGFLLLLESKCLKSVQSEADDYRAMEEVEEAIDQLIRRRSMLAECWAGIRQAAPELDLPRMPPSADRVLCIAVTNLLRYTAYARDDVVVTDDYCLERFFGSATVRKIALSHDHAIDLGAVARIRASDVPSPQELRDYLRSPPQMSRVRPDIKVVRHVIPGFNEKLGPLVIPRIEFRPGDSDQDKSDSAKREAVKDGP